MMRKFLVLILYLLMARSGFAQINFNYLQTDSLRNELSKAKHDTSRVLLMSGLAEAYRWSKPDSAMYYGQNALALADKINFKRGEASALLSLSVVQRELGNLARGLDFASKALAIAQGRFSGEEITALLRVANVYSASKDYSKALIYLRQAENKSALAGNRVYANISQWLITQALEQKNELDSAKHYADTALKNWGWGAGAGYAYHILGDLQLKLKKDSLALHYYWLGLVNSSRTSDYRTIANLSISLANYYKSHNQIDSAIYYSKNALAVAQLLSYKNRIISSSGILAEIYETRDPKEALRYYKIFNAAKDSLYGADKMLALQNLMIDEQEGQKEAEAKQLAYQNRIKQYGLLTVLLFVTVVVFLLYRNNRRKQKANELLEKQKKEIEEQRTKAEIETALEKIRTIAMSMRKPDDMLQICKVIAQQLALLGIREIRNVQTAIFYEEKGTYTNYEFYVKHEKALVTETEFRNHPVAEAFAEQMMKRANEFFAHSFSGNEVKDWLEYQKGTNVFIDSYLETATSLNYFWYSMGPVALGLSTYDSLSEEQIKLFKRFRNVFQLSYRRYLDIEKAETQTRESQIQLALERVRARTMAMQHSDELAETAQILFQQFKQLGEDPIQITIGIFNEAQNVIEFRVTGGDGSGSKIDQTFNASIEEPTLINKIFKAWKQNKKSDVISLEGKELMDWITYRNTMSGKHAYETKVQIADRRYVAVGFFSKGILSISTTKSLPEETIQTLERFSSVFDLTYTRFLDLKHAEGQAREARIETALERVRGSAMAMHNSNDISYTTNVIFEELKKLGIESIRCGIALLSKNSVTAQVYAAATSDDGGLKTLYRSIEMTDHSSQKKQYESWLEQKNYIAELKGEELRSYYRLPFFYASPSYVPPEDYGQTEYGYYIPFSKGLFYAWTKNPYSENEMNILNRFKANIDIAFRRYLDLRKAEAQTREAQIEAALEKVRSKTLAMQHSDELADTAAVLFRQLIYLGIEPNRLYIGITEENSANIEFWITDEDGSKVSTVFNGDATKNYSIQKMVDGWRQKKKSIVLNMHGEELENYFHYLGTELHVPFKEGLSQKRRWQYIAFFSKGFIGMASPDEQPPQSLQLLERFAYVFNLTFTRFNDLKIAEAHALQAEQDLIEIKQARKKAEDALLELKATQQQLIQSEKMASLGELTAGIAHEIQNPLNFVNNFSEVSAELIDEIKSELDKGEIGEAKAIADDVKQNLEKIAHHGKRADAIVKSMLQHSRKSAGQKDLVDINSLVDEYLRMSYHGFRAKDKSFNAILETHFDPDIKTANIIGQDIGRVLLNLFNNAFYAVNEKKKEEQNGFEPIVQVATFKLNNLIEIKVKDNGKGIPAKVLEKIYQPFFTTKPTGEGTGLGLSLSYDIITKGHGGELRVETVEGEGSEFIIQLPNLSSL